jgi:hypothetical protein
MFLQNIVSCGNWKGVKTNKMERLKSKKSLFMQSQQLALMFFLNVLKEKVKDNLPEYEEK